MLRTSYACSDMTLTQSFYDLSARTDQASNLKMHDWVIDSARMRTRPCRFFHPNALIQIHISDDGFGFTCISDSEGLPNDHSCYWARTIDLDTHQR